MASHGSASALLLAAVLTVTAACGDGGGQLTPRDVEDLYLGWQEDRYGPGLADDTIDGVGEIRRDGACTAAQVTEEEGHEVTVFFRDGEVVEVVTGHSPVDDIDTSSDTCWAR